VLRAVPAGEPRLRGPGRVPYLFLPEGVRPDDDRTRRRRGDVRGLAGGPPPVLGPVHLGLSLGVSPFIIGATLVAGGTSLPEISVSVVAVRKGEVGIAVGNVLGSNIVNSFAVMGVPSLLGPLTVPGSVRTYALPVMVLATLSTTSRPRTAR
jgi:hypothetical protein